MAHTWSDVAYSFVNGSGVKGDIPPLVLVLFLVFVGVMVYIYVRFR